VPHPNASDAALKHFDQTEPARRQGAPCRLRVRVVCAQHLPKPSEERIAPDIWDQFDPQSLLPGQPRAPSLAGASSVYCTLEAWHAGGKGDKVHAAAEEPIFHTKLVQGNGLNPSWDEGTSWGLPRPNAAFVRLSVYQRTLLRDEVLGAEVLPVLALRQGFRSVSLRTAKGLRLQLAAVLVHIRFEELEDSSDS